MMKTLDQALSDARQAHSNSGVGRAGVTVVTNQSGGIASYATGVLYYSPPVGSGHTQVAERLSTRDSEPLTYLFSNRTVPIPITTGGENSLGGTSILSPFAATSSDKLGLSSTANGPAKLTLHTRSNHKFNVPVERRADVLVGTGEAIPGGPAEAVYVISFHEPPPGQF